MKASKKIGHDSGDSGEKHFYCTRCGKCCHGWLPLTVADAFAHADTFPLAMIWTPVPKGTRSFELTLKLGARFQSANGRQQFALSIVPTAYLPTACPCPMLMPDNRCGIHERKPLRCRAMPFFPYRREDDQAEAMKLRPGWLCDTAPTAPLVYRDKKIIDREHFDLEREALLQQADGLRDYAQFTIQHYPLVNQRLHKAIQRPIPSKIIVGFHSFLRYQKQYDRVAFAKAQRPVLLEFANRVAGDRGLSEYHKYYVGAAEDLAWLANRTDSHSEDNAVDQRP